jgi:hypothetical protein
VAPGGASRFVTPGSSQLSRLRTVDAIEEIEEEGTLSQEQSRRLRFEKKVRISLERRPTYILDIGYLVLSFETLCVLASAAFFPKLALLVVGLTLATWASINFVDAILRGKAAIDLRLSTLALVIAIGSVSMGIVGLAVG